VNLYNKNRDGLRFILGHEMGHIRLHHVSLWYQIAVAYSQRIPLLGHALSRLREYSCDRHGAYLSTTGRHRAGPRIWPIHRERRQHPRACSAGSAASRLLGRPRTTTEITPLHGTTPRTSLRRRTPQHPGSERRDTSVTAHQRRRPRSSRIIRADLARPTRLDVRLRRGSWRVRRNAAPPTR
jgi:hypothetical protein